MMEEPTNSKALFAHLIQTIHDHYSHEEKRTLASRLMQSIAGISAADLLLEKPIPARIASQFNSAIDRINGHEPWQYIVGNADFFGRPFRVSPAVLIPRPETEELVDRVIQALRHERSSKLIVDVGTGSGCIAVTLSLEMPQHNIAATDVSAEALDVAGSNAMKHRAAVAFCMHNILRADLPWMADVIVSNPPYIADDELRSLPANVADFEPRLALLAGPDPLIFYRALARQGRQFLKPGGTMFVETNERYGREVASLFRQSGFIEAAVVTDTEGKDRIVSAMQPLT